jgi:hypothetical protein
VKQLPPQTRTFALHFDVVDSGRWFIGLFGTVEDLVWDKLAFHAGAARRQDHRQNLSLSERFTGRELRPLLGRLLIGRS